MSSPTVCRRRRELARRVSGGMEITLYWHPGDDSTSIEVWQPAFEERLASPVPRKQALDAFYHPFTHLPITSGEPSRVREAGARS